MTARTYTYTAQDYFEVFGNRKHGFVGVNPDGDLIWTSDKHIVWAAETMVLDMVDLTSYKAADVIYAPSAMMKSEFDARQ